MFLLSVSLLLFSIAVEGKDYTVEVKTSNELWAGTDATIKIRVRGTRGRINEIPLPSYYKYFERGKTDVFTIQDYNVDIGYVTGMDVYRDNKKYNPDWRLDYIIIKIVGAPDSIFNYNAWVDDGKWIPLPLSCRQGYFVNDGHYCAVQDVNECLVNNPCIAPAKCRNLEGSYACDCPDGYEPIPGNKNQCRDKDDCLQSPCDIVKSTCDNFPGGYRCNCRPGYQNVNSKQCQNINECIDNTHSCNITISSCVDTGGSYECRCKQGYTRGSTNKLCQPVRCGAPYGPAGSKLEPARCTLTNANVFGDKCVIKCNAGYVISDISNAVITCGSSGNWEGTMATCNAVTCPKLPAIPNGKILPPSCSSTGGKYNYNCFYSCLSGYSLLGTSQIKCQADGTWNVAVPTCKKIEVKPWIRCPDLISQDLLPGKSTADVSSVWRNPTSNVQQITISPPEISSSYQFPPGETKVTWTASNAVGSESCSIYVLIYDREAPKVTNCPADIHQIVSQVPKAVTWVEPTFSDNVKVTKIEKSIPNGSNFSWGSTYVSYTVLDAAGNRNIQCRFKVQLKRPSCSDLEGPVGGSKSCSSFGGSSFCSVTCNSGSRLYKESALFWTCDKGKWTPGDVVPDCVEVVKKNSTTTCQENQIEMIVFDITINANQPYCAKCPSGMFKSSQTDCSPCPAGTYNDQQGQLQCSLTCPTGTSSLPGAKSISDCKPKCSAGQFSETGLGPNCHYCPRDTYQDKVQQKSCIPCPNGTFTLALGADSLSNCGARPHVTRIDPRITNIKEKESVTVNCFASGIPTPTYIWKFLKDIPSGFLGKMSQSNIKNSNGEVIGAKLSIEDATYENTGSYECSVTNTHGQDKDLGQINVAKVFYFGSGSDESL